MNTIDRDHNLATDPCTPLEALIELSKDEDSYVPRNLTKNPNTTIDILIELSKHEDKYVRLFVTENYNIPIELSIKLLEELYKDQSEDEYDIVSGIIAKNPNIPLYILIELSKDKNHYVSSTATQNRINRISLLK